MITVKHLKNQLDLLRDDYDLNVFWNTRSGGVVIYEKNGSLIGTIDFNQENDNETINSED